MPKLTQLKEDNPELEVTPEMADNTEMYDKVHDLKVLYDTPGGKVLVKSMVEGAIDKLHFIRGNYSTLTHQELIKHISQIDVHLDVARSLMNAEEAMKLLDEEIKEALRE